MDHVHFVGINGAGMKGLAILARKKGFRVTGNDRTISASDVKSFNTDDIPVSDLLLPPELASADLVCYSTAISRDHPSLKFSIDRGIHLLHRSEFLNRLINMGQSVAISGSHGKSSTTAMLAHISEISGVRPSCVVGAQLMATGNSYVSGEDFFIVEADDHDGTLPNILPMHSIITNIDREHLENYGSIESLKRMYVKYIRNIPQEGWLVACNDSKYLMDAVSDVGRGRLVTYGYGDNANVKIKLIGGNLRSSRFTLAASSSLLPHELFGVPITTTLTGEHGVANTTAAIIMASLLGWDPSHVLNAPSSYGGLDRRMRLVGEAAGIPVIDDYAHHPTEIRAVLDLVKGEYSGRVLVVFEPHRHARVGELLLEFSECFVEAELVLVLPVYSPGESGVGRIDEEDLAKAIHSGSKTMAVAVDDVDAAVKVLVEWKPRKLDAILLLGAGNLSKSRDTIFKALNHAIDGRAI